MRHFLGISLSIISRTVLFVFIISVALVVIGLVSPTAG